MSAERCEFCGRFGARRTRYDRGPDGHGGRQALTFYECPRCEGRNQRDVRGDLTDNSGVTRGGK